MAKGTTVEFAGTHRGWSIHRVVLRSREIRSDRGRARPQVYFEVRNPQGAIIPGGPKTYDDARALIDEELGPEQENLS